MESIKEIVPMELQNFFVEEGWKETEGLWFINYSKSLYSEVVDYKLEVGFSCVDGMNCMDISLIKGFMKFRLNHDYSLHVGPDWEELIRQIHAVISLINQKDDEIP